VPRISLCFPKMEVNQPKFCNCGQQFSDEDFRTLFEQLKISVVKGAIVVHTSQNYGAPPAI